MKKIQLTLLVLLFTFSVSYGQELNASQEITKAVDAIEKIEKANRWVDKFSNDKLTELPVGIRKTINNIQYSIVIREALLLPEHTTLAVFCRVDIPQKDKNGKPIQLFFGAEDVKLSHEGGIIGEAKLVLLGNVDIPFSQNRWQVSLYGGFDLKNIPFADLTYLTIDCDGFKEMKISGAVAFSRDLILPIDPVSKMVDEAKKTITKTYYNGNQTQISNEVRGEFNTTIDNWNDILVDVSLDAFVLKDKRNTKNYDGNFEFLASNAVLDLSDIKNSSNIVFPNDYMFNGILLPNEQSWKGVFIENFKVGLPKEFRTNDSESKKERVTVESHNLIIDKFGVSNTFSADNVFALDEGITSTKKAWHYSLEHIDVAIEANTFLKANINGVILLPISKPTPKKDPGSSADPTKGEYGSIDQLIDSFKIQNVGLPYTGFISMDECQLTAVTKDSITFDLWKARALLHPNSSIELKLKDGHFLPKANLNGVINFAVNKRANDLALIKGGKAIDFRSIIFEDLQLQTVSPYIAVRNMSYKGKARFANFPVTIGDIKVVCNDDTARIDFDLGISLMDELGASASARIGIKGKMDDDGVTQQWKFDGLDLSGITVDCQFGGIGLKGNLILMQDDPVYGDGFSADLQVDIVKKINFKAKAIFGRSTFKYWYFDAAAQIEGIAGSPFMITGFGGGGYYKMRRNDNIAIANFSPSGLSYTPDESVKFGIKALVTFFIGSDVTCKGEAGFEMEFNQSGGINSMSLFGKANLLPKVSSLQDITKLIAKVAADKSGKESILSVTEKLVDKGDKTSKIKKKLNKANKTIPSKMHDNLGITMTLGIEFDCVNNSVHGEMDTFVNTPLDILKGTGKDGRAGAGVFHYDEQDWYLYNGTPDNRCGIKLGFGGIYVKTGSYFMAGTVLPGSPSPPPNVADVLGVDVKQLQYMRDENALKNGGGIAFGANLQYDTGDLGFALFYARFQSGLGFDLMLKDYQQAKCYNTGDQVGINGWYANGQAYAYLQGELGVKVNLALVTLKVPIISGNTAAILQAKLPNPVWMQGHIAGNMNVLGGLIKGKFRFKLELGEKCQFEQETPLGGIKIITDVTPKEGSGDVDVFAVPQAAFCMKINEAFVIPEEDEDVTYKIILEKFKVFDEGKEISGSLEWSAMKDRVNFISSDILPPRKKLKVQIEVSFQKLVDGIFKTIEIDGQVAKEFEERTFTTGGAPNYIPLNNVQYSYPAVNQRYFLEDEYPKGYIQLKRGQDYLFEDGRWETKVKLNQDGTSNFKSAVFTYESNSNQIYYNLPNIDQEKKYNFSIVSSFKGDATKNGSGKTKVNANKFTDEGNDIEIRENQANELSKAGGEIDRLNYSFATSKYKTFRSKMNAIKTKGYNFGVLYSDVIYLSTTIDSDEAFDIADLQGVSYADNKPLISAESRLDDEYYRTDIFPYLYRDYPLNGTYHITQRDTEEYGVVPAKAITLNASYINSVENNVNHAWTRQNFPFKYNLPLVYKQDWTDLNNQIIRDYFDGVAASLPIGKRFLNSSYLFMRYGTYDIELKYNLPGDKKSSPFIYTYKNKNSFR
ncbi:hypothetical protein B0A66_05475 [Flavobacterium hercynium]|uniref:DUF490 domain-containing protein n=1 Tax=Flavobacterium hercynium TaxID=387094 RepID=A0A226HK21_9FLAO|nr:hypothetical protein B0A66_05475 [Flavobacterium hercynium]